MSKSEIKTVPQKPPSGDSEEARVNFPKEQSIGYLIRDNHRSFSRLLASRIAAEEVTVGMWYFLRALWEEDGMTQRELSRRIGAVEPAAVTALDLMERRGLVRRDSDPRDRRRRLVYLTTKAKRLRSRLLPYAIEVNEVALRGIPEEDIQQLQRILLRIKVNFQNNGTSPT